MIEQDSVEGPGGKRRTGGRKHPFVRTAVTLALGLELLNVGQDLVKGEGNPLTDAIGFYDLSLNPHFPSLKSLLPPNDPEHPRTIRSTIVDILNSPRDLTKNAVTTIRDSVPHMSNQPILEQAQVPEIRNEWGYNIWGRPVTPN